MIHLRELNLRDAEGMLEWMHDPDIQLGFQTDMMTKTIDDVKAFIKNVQYSLTEGNSMHFAIADEQEEYLGTISLKDISLRHKRAEYAVSLRRQAQGRGIASEATQQLLTLSFQKLGLEKVYLNVLSENIRAIHLYERCGFVYEGTARNHLYLRGEFKTLQWYSILKKEYLYRNSEDKMQV